MSRGFDIAEYREHPLPYSIRLKNQPHTPVPVQVVLPLVPRPPLAGHLESTETLDPLSYAEFRREVPYKSNNVVGPEWLSGEQEYHYLQCK
nr:unnamed protein product [Callosobruchus chinensis]